MRAHARGWPLEVVVLVLGIIGAVVMVALLVGLYVRTRRTERDIEIPARVLTDDEKQANIVRGAASSNIISGGGAFG